MAHIQGRRTAKRLSLHKIIGIVILLMLLGIITFYFFDGSLQTLDHARILFGISSLLAIVGMSLIGRSK